ncbi:MAG: hypothetical protein DRO94_05075 [Candidatus Altiarchaeales archaeon]|nr:MAG: hypothetical protein DRO95_05745 [Candidatus Altiarchaeales archaeon]RLI93492.1 MAG: hypothetical protein DRO94_05075 [Candidatus Altiarchaeales archaeon]
MVSIKVDLSRELIHEIDKIARVKGIKDRSRVVEELLTKILIGNMVKRAVILAGGKGTRMRPFTYEIPKPLIPVQGKPLLQHIIELLRKYEIRDIIISTGYLGSKIVEYFGNGNKFGVRIEYVEEDKELGTAGPLNLMRDKLKSTFLMFNGDVLANIDIHDLIRFHHEHNALATIALTPVKDPSRFGVARLRGNKILEFIEKPEKTTKSKLINAGVYVLEPEVIDYVPEGKAMIEHDVFPKLAAEGKLYGYPFDGQWFDTGTPEAYERAIKEWRGVE